MAVLNNASILKGASAAGGSSGYQIEKSLRFNPDDTPELTMTPSSGDSKQFTISFWTKFCKWDSTYMIIQTDETYADLFRLYFSSGKFRVHQYESASDQYFWEYISTRVFRDPSAWYHVVFSYDARNLTEANRARTWINGVQITDWDTVDHPNQFDDAGYNQTATKQRIGREYTTTYGSYYKYDGYLAEFYSIDGQSLDASAFGEIDETTGQWVAKAYTGTYGRQHNQAEVWSDDMSGTSNSGSYTGLFDGTMTGYEMGADNQTLTYTPDGGISATTSIRIQLWQSSGTYAGSADITVNGSSVKTAIGTAMGTGSVGGWFDIGTTSLTSLTWSNPTGSNNDYRLYAIEVDGKMLTDTGVTPPADNSFYLKFNGTDLGEDSSGNDNDFTATNLTPASTTFDVPCVSFDGTDDYLEIADHADLGFGGGDFTVECFVRPETPGSDSYHDIAGSYQSSAGSYNVSSWRMTCYSKTDGTSNVMFYFYHGANANYANSSYILPHGKWSHIVGTRQGDNLRIYVDGVQKSSIDISSYVDMNDSSSALRIGSDVSGNNDLKGSVSNLRVVKGTCLYPDGTTFTVPSRPLANVTNTKLLCCQSSSTTADDNSDNDHTITASGNAAAGTKSDDTTDDDVSTDSPTSFDDGGNGTGNYCTWNPLCVTTTANSLAQGNLEATHTTGWAGGLGANGSTFIGTIGMTSGKWYFEGTVTGGTGLPCIGITPVVDGPYYVGYAGNGIGYTSNAVYNTDWLMPSTPATPSTFTTGDVIGVAVDMDNGFVWFSKNGTWQGSGDPTSTNAASNGAYGDGFVGETMFPAASQIGSTESIEVLANFGARTFAYTPPTGFKALNTYNLPDPVITDPSKYFKTVTYDGTGAADNVITGDKAGNDFKFSPDVVWLKARDEVRVHSIHDTVRGDNKILYPTWTDGEGTINGVEFGTNSYTLGSDAYVNSNGKDWVAWNWDAGTATSNTSVSTGDIDGTNPTIASEYRVNTDAGLSIVTWDGHGATNETVAHGLGAKPDFMICKKKSTGGNSWIVWHKGWANTAYASLNATTAVATDATLFNSHTALNSNTFSLGTNNSISDTSQTAIAYLWSEVAGYSKFGTFIGNGLADGPFIYCGFKPAFIMFGPNGNYSDWYMYDNERWPHNPAEDPLAANEDDTEANFDARPVTNHVDILSNGFKLRFADASGYHNYSTWSYSFVAFAEKPLKYANAR